MWDPCREIHLSCFDKGTGNEKLHTHHHDQIWLYKRSHKLDDKYDNCYNELFFIPYIRTLRIFDGSIV